MSEIENFQNFFFSRFIVKEYSLFIRHSTYTFEIQIVRELSVILSKTTTFQREKWIFIFFKEFEVNQLRIR